MKLSIVAATEMAQLYLGTVMAKALLDKAIVIYLYGDLGTGKTTLVRGLLRGLGYEDKVKSPTYTLVEHYQLHIDQALSKYDRDVLHFDLYRIRDHTELAYLGVEDLVSDNTLWLVEWPERGIGWLPAADLLITIHHSPRGRDLNLMAATEDGVQILTTFMQHLQLTDTRQGISIQNL